MPIQIISSAEAAALHGVKVLVHGRAGVGKTRLCATAPAPIILSAEAGMLSLRQYKLPTVIIRSMQDLAEAYMYLRGGYALLERQFGPPTQFRTACLDSISEIAEVCLKNEKGKSKDPRRAYGEMQDQMTDLIRGFRDLPGFNVYFSAKQTQNKDEMTGALLYGPSMPGQKLGPALPYFFDEVFCLDVARQQDGTVYGYLRTRADGQFEAKDRSGALDPFEPPDLGLVIQKIANATSHT